MKKILMVVALLGFGFMVGCEPEKTTTHGTTSAGPSGTTMHSTTTPTGSAAK